MINRKMFEADEFRADAPRQSNAWATSDRGWIRLNYLYHPQRADKRIINYMKSTYGKFGACCGNYVDYAQGTSRGPNGETFHACAYILIQSLGGGSEVRLGSAWFTSAAESRNWIESQVKAYLAKSKQEVSA